MTTFKMAKFQINVIFIVCVKLSVIANEVDPEIYLSQFGSYNPFTFNGKDGLQDAIKEFQDFHRLAVTGVIDDATKSEMAKPRCGLPDKSGHGNAYYATRSKWTRTTLTYAFENTGRDLDSNTAKNEIKKAFNMWAAVTPLTFTEVSGRGDINIGWYSGNHGRGDFFPRGRGGVLAHAYFPQDGRLHFDEDESWIVNCQGRGTDLLWVAVHEIGHAIGLDHSRVRGSIMWPTYFRCDSNLKLGPDDISGIQSLYGSGTGTGGTGTGGGNCPDGNSRCEEWANRGECQKNPRYMLRNCRKSCKQC